MKVITVESESYKSLVRKIDRIYSYITEQRAKQAAPPDPSGVWVDNTEAAELLEVSTRTLQRLRSNGEVTYSIRGGKIRYRLSEIQRLIVGRVVAGKHKQEADLLAAKQAYHERSKKKKSNNQK